MMFPLKEYDLKWFQITLNYDWSNPLLSAYSHCHQILLRLSVCRHFLWAVAVHGMLPCVPHTWTKALTVFVSRTSSKLLWGWNRFASVEGELSEALHLSQDIIGWCRKCFPWVREQMDHLSPWSRGPVGWVAVL